MDNIVVIKRDDVFTDSMILSEGTGIRHDKLKETIRRHEERLRKYGKLSPSYGGESTGGRRLEIYALNEPQATFLITLLKNTDNVVDFKDRLVGEFFRMRQQLMQRQTQTWIESRAQGKLTRQSETDVIKDLVEYAKGQGSKNSEKLYVVYTKLANSKAGITERDQSTVTEINNLALIENIILHMIREGIIKNKHYKEIYQDCKRRLDEFIKMAYLTASGRRST